MRHLPVSGPPEGPLTELICQPKIRTEMSDDFPVFSARAADTPVYLAGTRIEQPSLQDLVMHAESLVRERSRRRDYLDGDLLGEPAWDMLLLLFVAGVERRWMTQSSLAAFSGVPATTALRWLSVLTERGLAQQRLSWSDQRTVVVALQADGYATMYGLISDSCLTARARTGEPQ